MSEDKCVMCGTVIPEGTQVCPMCTRQFEVESSLSLSNLSVRFLQTFLIILAIFPLRRSLCTIPMQDSNGVRKIAIR